MDKTDDQILQITAQANCCSINNDKTAKVNNSGSAKQVLINSDTSSKTVSINKCHSTRSSINSKISSSSSSFNTRRKSNSRISKTYLKASTFKYRYKIFKSHVDDGLASRMESMSLKNSEMVRLCGDTVASSCDLLKPVSERSLTPKIKPAEQSHHTKYVPTPATQGSPSKGSTCCDCPQSVKLSEGDTNVLSVKITSPQRTNAEEVSPALSSTRAQKKNCRLKIKKTCSAQARSEWDFAADDLASYMTDCWVLPKEMSSMAEMMYT